MYSMLLQYDCIRKPHRDRFSTLHIAKSSEDFDREGGREREPSPELSGEQRDQSSINPVGAPLQAGMRTSVHPSADR